MSEPTDVYISKHSGGVLEGGLIAIDAVFRCFLNAQELGLLYNLT